MTEVRGAPPGHGRARDLAVGGRVGGRWIAIAERATGLSRTTIRAGRDKLRGGVTADDVVAIRRPGGGRPRLEDRSPAIVEALELLMGLVTRGDHHGPGRGLTLDATLPQEPIVNADETGHRTNGDKR